MVASSPRRSPRVRPSARAWWASGSLAPPRGGHPGGVEVGPAWPLGQGRAGHRRGSARRGVDLRILTGTLAAAWVPTGEGKFFFTMMAAFAELERDMIHERTMAGLAASRRQGRIGGRPSVMDDDEVAAAKARRAACQSPTQIAKALGFSRATVYRHPGATSAPSEERFTGVAPSAPVKHPGLDVLLDLDRVAGARLEVVLLRARARPGARRCRRSRRGCV